jgi:RecB family exonuclease
MADRSLHLVPTESHVDEALAAGWAASTVGSFLERRVADLPVKIAAPEVTTLAVAMALESMPDESANAGPTLASAFDEGLGALRRAGVGADVVRRSASRRGRLLAALLERTDDMLKASALFDRRALGWVAAEAIGRGVGGDLPSSVVIDGVFDFDPSQLAWMEALSRRVPVTVRLPRRAPDAILSVLESRWHALPAAPELELGELAVPDDVQLIEGRTDAAEARAIARIVASALAIGIPAEGIAIVVPDLDETFLEPLERTLDEARVPFREPRGRLPAGSPVVRAALAWLGLASGPLDRDVLVDLLRTRAVDPAPFVEGSTPDAQRQRALALANRLLRIPVRSDRDGNLLAEVLASELAARGTADETWMLDAVERIAALRHALAKEATRAEMAHKLVAAWQSMGLVDPSTRTVRALVRADPRSRESDLLSAEVRDHAIGFRALLAATSGIVSAAATLGVEHVRVSTSRFRLELEQALGGAMVEGTRRPGAVRIVRVSEVLRVKSDLLVVARANDTTLDAAPSGSAVLDDALVGGLPASSRPHSSRDSLAIRRMSVLAAIDGARRLAITRSRTDAEGRPLAPAPLFIELASGRKVASEPASRLHAGASVLSSRDAELGLLSRGGQPDGDVARRARVERDRLTFFLDPRAPASAFTGAIAPDETVSALLQRSFGGTSDQPIAATGIERASQCHFSAFAGAVLGASSVETLGEGLEPWQRGSLIHRALLLAFEAIRRRWSEVDRGELDRDELVAIASTAAKKALLRDKVAPLYRAEVERALRDVAAVVEWSLDDDSGFRFAEGERSFGERVASNARDAWPSLVIGAGARSVFVKGRIDRVDFSTDGSRARVIDYKTGALPAWKDVGTLYFQPLLYAYAVLMQMGRLSVPELRALYLETSRRPPRTLPAEKSQVLSFEAMKSADARAARVVAELWNGEVAPRPADASICGRCDVRDICRRPAAMPVEELEPENDGTGG